MSKKLLLVCFFSGIAFYGNAQDKLNKHDTILVFEDGHVSDFRLCAVVPQITLGVHLMPPGDSYKVYVQVDACIDVDENGNLNNPQHNSAQVTIFAIKDLNSGEIVYKNDGKSSDANVSNMISVLTCYYQQKFSQINYFLYGQFHIPPRIRYFYPDIIQ